MHCRQVQIPHRVVAAGYETLFSFLVCYAQTNDTSTKGAWTERGRRSEELLYSAVVVGGAAYPKLPY